MLLDHGLVLSSAQPVTASAPSENVIDLGAAGSAYGEELNVIVQVRETADVGTHDVEEVPTPDVDFVTIKVETSVDEAFSSPIILFETEALGSALIIENAQLVKTALPSGLKRFVRVNYVVSGDGDLTAGKFDAFLTTDVKAG